MVCLRGTFEFNINECDDEKERCNRLFYEEMCDLDHEQCKEGEERKQTEEDEEDEKGEED
ncbi:hypothetical protein N7537_007001 [Penicillium hordei]|uniref:Uncharacterized protein n=1 Tax=Penicillium hordei TaxID=40994 RepID=A0AAD6H4X8_9EURO|nr:uncharacterized protein N7537_007001 [Penicillium hordei]KAJ5604045.1 hypothetical protein N7537_007001 [Penicillium hordei]